MGIDNTRIPESSVCPAPRYETKKTQRNTFFSATNQAEGPVESSMMCPSNTEIILESAVKNPQESILGAYSIPVLITNRTYNRRKQRHLTTTNTRMSVPSNCIKISTDTKMSKQTVPSVFLTNACHILNKIDELSAIAEINGPDIVCISESWLDCSISDSIVSIGPSYTHIGKTEKP